MLSAAPDSAPFGSLLRLTHRRSYWRNLDVKALSLTKRDIGSLLRGLSLHSEGKP